MYLDMWSPVGRTATETSGYEALLAEVRHWGWALRVYSTAPLPVHSASGVCGRDVSLSFLLPTAALAFLPRWTASYLEA